MKIVCISDTHGLHDKIYVPDGDMLIHAGDMSMMGQPKEIVKFSNWLKEQPHKYKIIIAGNHDFLFEKEPTVAQDIIEFTVAIYLNDSGVTIEGLNIWGSPVQPWFCDWAFNRQRGPEIKKHWDMIPDNTDILITHGPPWGKLDRAYGKGDHLGCEELLKAVYRVDPRLHVFGHIHGESGELYDGITRSINASMVDEDYQPNGKQFIVEL